MKIMPVLLLAVILIAFPSQANEKSDSSPCLQYPLKTNQIKVNFRFGKTMKKYPNRPHRGIDLWAKAGTPVLAAAGGTVTHAGENSLREYLVEVEYASGRTWGVVHLSRIDVSVGQTVKAGEIIGLSGGVRGSVGSGPRSTGAHLHFHVRHDGQFVDPEPHFCQPLPKKKRRRK